MPLQSLGENFVLMLSALLLLKLAKFALEFSSVVGMLNLVLALALPRLSAEVFKENLNSLSENI